MIFRRDKGKEIRLISFDLHNLFQQLAIDDARFFARSTPEITVKTPRGDYKIDVAKLAEEPFIMAQRGLEKQGISKEEAKKIKDRLMAKKETEALEYLRKRPELKEAIDDFVLKVQEVDESKTPMFFYWQILSSFVEAIRCYTAKDTDNPYVREVVFNKWFHEQVENNLKPNWPKIPQEIKNEMVSLLIKSYKGNEKIIHEVLSYLN